jgi:hypothetical protein
MWLMFKKNKRKSLVIDPSTQWAIIRYCMLFGVLSCLLLFTTALLCYDYFLADIFLEAVHSPRMREAFDVALFGALTSLFVSSASLLLICFGFSMVLSNKMAGPLLRLRRHMEEIAEGTRLKELVIRKGDFFQPVVDEYNHMLKERNLIDSPKETYDYSEIKKDN